MALLFFLLPDPSYNYYIKYTSLPALVDTQRTQIEANAAIYAVTGIAGVRQASAQGHRAGAGKLVRVD